MLTTLKQYIGIIAYTIAKNRNKATTRNNLVSKSRRSINVESENGARAWGTPSASVNVRKIFPSENVPSTNVVSESANPCDRVNATGHGS